MQDCLHLEVQTFRLSLTLGLQDALPCSSKVSHLNTHSPLSESHQPGLRAYGLDVSAGEVILLIDELIQINVLIQRHLGGMQGEDFLLGRLCY